MNKLSIKDRARILQTLVVGNSLRDTARMADVSRNTVDRLLRDVGEACLEYQDTHLTNLPCKRLQVNEIWSFVYAKAENLPAGMEDEAREVWTWTAIDAETKLVPCWHIGGRSIADAKTFIADLANRMANRIQLPSDGNRVYVAALEEAIGTNVDFAQLIKLCGGAKKMDSPERLYSGSEFIGTEKTSVNEDSVFSHVSTSCAERQNLTMRMSMRRFICLTNAFSKKIENHMYAISLHYMYYNFGRIHKTLLATPAMEAGVTDHVWSLEEIAGLLKEPESKQRGPYKKRNSK